MREAFHFENIFNDVTSSQIDKNSHSGEDGLILWSVSHQKLVIFNVNFLVEVDLVSFADFFETGNRGDVIEIANFTGHRVSSTAFTGENF